MIGYIEALQAAGSISGPFFGSILYHFGGFSFTFYVFGFIFFSYSFSLKFVLPKSVDQINYDDLSSLNHEELTNQGIDVS